MPATIQGTQMGNEQPNEDALRQIARILEQGERVWNYTAFDWGDKVFASTNRRVMVADKNQVEYWVTYDYITDVPETGHDREIRIIDQDDDEFTYRLGDIGIATFLKNQIRRQTRNRASRANRRSLNPESHDTPTTNAEYGSSSGERFRFWQEQDRINQELIPRVIRQNELLTQHIAEHENLPETAGRVISASLAVAREEQERQFRATATEIQAEFTQQLTQSLSILQDEMKSAKAELSTETAQRIREALSDLQKALDDHKSDLANQLQAVLEPQMNEIRRESRRNRNLLLSIVAGSTAVCIALATAGILI